MYTQQAKKSRARGHIHGLAAPAVGATLTALLTACGGSDDSNNTSPASVEVISSRANMVTGGNAMVRVKLPEGQTLSGWKVTAGGVDQTPAFASTGANSFLGLVKGLPVGNTKIEVAKAGDSGSNAGIEITNHPITGPVFACLATRMAPRLSA